MVQTLRSSVCTMCRTKIYCVLGNKLSLSETVNWYTSLPVGAVQTGVLWPCAPLESVASSVENGSQGCSVSPPATAALSCSPSAASSHARTHSDTDSV